jgi:ribonuclease G
MDFIDMKERRHRNAIYDKMVELMSSDKAKTTSCPSRRSASCR